MNRFQLGEEINVIDAQSGEALGAHKSFPAQEFARQVVDRAVAGGEESEVGTLKVIGEDLAAERRRLAIQAGKQDVDTANKDMARRRY